MLYICSILIISGMLLYVSYAKTTSIYSNTMKNKFCSKHIKLHYKLCMNNYLQTN